MAWRCLECDFDNDHTGRGCERCDGLVARVFYGPNVLESRMRTVAYVAAERHSRAAREDSANVPASEGEGDE